MRGKNVNRSVVLAAAAAVSIGASMAMGQVDTLQLIVNSTNGTAGGSIATYGYDPTGAATGDDTMYIGVFSPATNGAIRKVSHVSGAQTSTTLVTFTDLTTWERGNDAQAPNRAGGLELLSGMQLNPVAIGANPAYSLSYIGDGATPVTESGGTIRRNDLTQRIYTFNLMAVPSGSNPVPGFTSLTTKAAMAVAAGLASNTTTADNFGRQYAWSADGQFLYNWDSSAGTAFGGLWRTNAATGATSRIYTAVTTNICEPAVLSDGAGGDQVFIAGQSANAGGIDKITYNSGVATGPTNVVTVANLKAFLETSSTPVINDMATDADGDLFFQDNTTKNMYRLDSQGRLAKILSKAERDAFYGVTTNNNTLRMQTRPVSYTNGANTFNVTQVMYEETTGVNGVSGAYNFQTGDFNRDGVVDQTDIGLFKSKLTVKAGPALAAGDSRYDLNGNQICSWKDVKTLQQFYAFYDGDANMDKTVDTVDFNTLVTNFSQAGKTWTGADFDGNETVDTIDFSIMASNFGQLAPGDALGGLVPEPASLGLLALTPLLARRRR